MTRLVQDATKCCQLAKSFLKLSYEQVYRDIMLNWWLHDGNVETCTTLETVRDVVSPFSTYVEGFWTSQDPIRRYLACFLRLCELYFIAVKAVERNDSFALELILSEFQSIFFFCGMTNYKEVVWRQYENVYGAPVMMRETFRRNRLVGMNKRKSATAFDQLGELLNKMTVAIKKSKTIELCSQKPASVLLIAQCTRFCPEYLCRQKLNVPSNSSRKKRYHTIRRRMSEVVYKNELYSCDPDRNLSQFNMYPCLDSLKSPLRPPPIEKEKVAEAKQQKEEDATTKQQEEEDAATADDMLSMAAGQSRNIRNLVNRVIEGIMPEKSRPKGDDSDSDDDADFCHLLICSHTGALKRRYDASDTLRKATKGHVAGPPLMKAIRCWTNDPSQPPTVKVGILCTQNDVNRAIATQTEIGWLTCFAAL